MFTTEELQAIDRKYFTVIVADAYLRRQDRQLDRLYAYAKKLHCEKTIRTYLEVLI